MDDSQNLNRDNTNISLKEDPYELFRKNYEQDYYEEICRDFPNTGDDGDQILPNRIAMKRRLADFYYSNLLPPSRRRNSIINPPAGGNSTSASLQNNTQNGGSLFALEKFRDCAPSIVIVKNGDSVMLEPGKVGPLPRSHPFIVKLMRSVDSRRLTAELATVLRKYNATFYDGGCILGIVDYNTNIGIGNVGSGGASATPTGKKNAPIVHKVWLRPTYSSIIATLSYEFLHKEQHHPKNTQPVEAPPENGDPGEFFELESNLLKRLYSNIYLEPEMPTTVAKPNLEPYLPAPRIPPSFSMSLLYDEPSQKPPLANAAADIASSGSNVPFNRLRRFSAIEDFRVNKAATEAESIITADQVVQSIKMGVGVNSIVNNTYLPPSLQIYRTLQWEKRFESNQPSLYWGLNIYAIQHHSPHSAGGSTGNLIRMNQIEFLAFFWHSIENPVSTAPLKPESATNSSGAKFFNMPFTQRVYFKTLPMVEQYVNQVKRLMALEDCTRRLFNDVYNPNALRFQSMIGPGNITTGNLLQSNFPGYAGSGAGGSSIHFGGGAGFMRMYGQPPGSNLNMPSLDSLSHPHTHISSTASPVKSKKKLPPAPPP
jgi:hypothetical protein